MYINKILALDLLSAVTVDLVEMLRCHAGMPRAIGDLSSAAVVFCWE